MDGTLAQLLTYLFELERQLAAANATIDRLTAGAAEGS